MRSSSKVGRRSLAFITALATMLALAIPFAGLAGAAHGTTDPNQVTLEPQSSAAPSGTCQTFTATLRAGTTAAEGETVDIQVRASDVDIASDATVEFCVPTGANQTVVPNEDGDPLTDANDEPELFIAGECLTNNSGQCTFGVRLTDTNSNTTGTVTAFFDANNDAELDGNEPRDESAIAVQPGGEEAAENITCTPATDSNPDGTRHEFQCTVTDAQGRTLPDVTVTFDVTAGPNAEEVGPTNCGNETNQQGQTVAPQPDNAGGGSQTTAGACGYNDAGPNVTTSPPGTDTITAYVNQGAQPGQPAPTTGPDAGEPQTTIQKTWTGPGRTIDCDPETATNQIGTTHTITCTVTDINGQPVRGVAVDFDLRSGPGGGVTPTSGTTDANGQVTTQISTNTFEPTGTSVVRGEITANGQTARTECEKAAGNPTGSTAGVCFDDVSKTWTRGDPDPDPDPDPGDPEIVRHDRNVSIKFNHVLLPNRRGKMTRWLEVRGQVTTTDDFDQCSGSVPIKVQIRASGRWITRKSDTTSQNGRYGVIITDAPGRHRTVAPRFRITNEFQNREDRCNRAQAVKRHSHKRRR